MKQGSRAHIFCTTFLFLLLLTPHSVLSSVLSNLDEASVDQSILDEASIPHDEEPSSTNEEDGERKTTVTFEDLVLGSRMIIVLKDGTEIKGTLHQIEEKTFRLKCQKNVGFGKVTFDYPVVRTSDILRIESYQRSWSNITLAALLASGVICIWVISVFSP